VDKIRATKQALSGGKPWSKLPETWGQELKFFPYKNQKWLILPNSKNRKLPVPKSHFEN
jgi:hypothetical protein